MQDDLELIRRLQNRESKALSTIYDRYSGAIYGVIIRICKNEEQAQDLLQETFLKIWQKADQYDPKKGKFFTWTYRIAKNITLNSLRKPVKLIQNEDISVYKDEGIEENVTDTLALDGSLKQLEPHHQKALELIYFNGLTHREAHEEMNVPLGTFKSYVKQALKKLRQAYQKEVMLLWVLLDMMI